MLSACLCLDVNCGGSNHSRCTQRLVIFLVCPDLLINPDRTQKNYINLIDFMAENRVSKKVGVNGHFKPAEPDSQWDDCLFQLSVELHQYID